MGFELNSFKNVKGEQADHLVQHFVLLLNFLMWRYISCMEIKTNK